MAFGQAAGPPATSQQVRALGELLTAGGYSDFRDARGPLGLSQRQAGGKFTRDEADELIERLEREAEMAVENPDGGQVESTPTPRVTTTVDRREAERAKTLAKFSDQALAAELQRRGWVVMEP